RFCIVRLLLWTSGATLIIWASLDPRFRTSEGFLDAAFCVPVACGVALMILGWATHGRWWRFAVWLALALVGQAAALQMIEAGPLIHYQHYKPIARLLTETHPFLLVSLVLQTALVAAGLRNRWPSIREWVGHRFRGWQVLAVGLIFFLSSAPLSREIPSYVAEVLFAAFIQSVNLANIVLILMSIPEGALRGGVRPLKRIFESLRGESELSHPATEAGASGCLDRYSLVAAVWVTVAAIALAVFSYERHPHLADEVVYLAQARFLAHGHLTVPAPPIPDAFNVYLMEIQNNRWYPSPPPGWPAILALGVLLGLPWLVNPVLAGLNVLLTFSLLKELYDLRTARISLLLLSVSPWHLFMAMNYMPHTSTLTCALVAAVAMIRSRRTEKAGWGWVSGIATGMASLIRPLEGFVLSGLLGLWAIG
ncbi:MAG TPA: glycosyltransferase family 39 protein, partial [Candidatus Methylomirabilis sp.]|nr:glycosyltransferase family 39 protein [Candidatus Methylomirabilis sp.]